MAAPAPDPLLLDELAANATTAGTAQLLDGWLLRAAPELPFRRCNSVVPFPTDRPVALAPAARIELAERFYGARGLATRFQVISGCSPRDLDNRLEERGYRFEAPVSVQVAAAEQLVSGDVDVDGLDLHVCGVLDLVEGPAADGFDDAMRQRLAGYASLLGSIGPSSFGVKAVRDGSVVAIGIGVVERGWLGVFGMSTREDARRAGAARAVLGALAAHGMASGAHSVYLQVEVDNDAALSLYRTSGFRESHSYHYRTLDSTGGSARSW